MAFGFLVEKFDLFLEVAAPSLVGRAVSLPGQRFGNWAGLALIVLGTAIIAIAAIRFLLTAKNIDSEELHPGPDRGLMWRLPFYSYLSAVPCSFTCLMRLSPRNKDGPLSFCSKTHHRWQVLAESRLGLHCQHRWRRVAAG